MARIGLIRKQLRREQGLSPRITSKGVTNKDGSPQKSPALQGFLLPENQVMHNARSGAKTLGQAEHKQQQVLIRLQYIRFMRLRREQAVTRSILTNNLRRSFLPGRCRE